MLRIFCFTVILLFYASAFAQVEPSKKITIGIEQDLLPYATGGYFAGFWVGKNHLRTRALMARVHKPDFIIEKGFTNNRVTAYALTLDYFLKERWNGWWAGAGVVNWKSSIQTDLRASTANYNNWLLNGSIGYNIKLYKHFYISPWAGMHIRVAGDKVVEVDHQTFTPPLLNPEASVKVGYYF
jgi:hypothetical protein